MDTATKAHHFLECLIKKYPPGDERLGTEIKTLKRKLDIDAFSDCDEDELIREVEKVEAEQNGSKKQKLEHSCDICGKSFLQKCNKTQHMKTHCLSFNCKKCGKSFYRDYYRNKHEKRCTGESTSKPTYKLNCKHCGVGYDTYETLFQHVIANHPLKKEENNKKVQQGGDVTTIPKNNFSKNDFSKKTVNRSKESNHFLRKGALNDAVNQTVIVPEGLEKHDILQFFADTKIEVNEELKMRCAKLRNIKWYLNAKVEMVRNVDDGTKEKASPHFRSKTYISLENDGNDHNLNEAFQKMNGSLEEFIHKGSNWVVNKIVSLEVHTVKYSPVSGSSYMELPPKLRLSHGVINIKNEDQKCFLWSVLAALHPVQTNSNYVAHYKDHEHSLDMTGIDFPVSLSKVEKFEKQNNLSINVFGYEKGHVFPLFLTKIRNGFREINLLYLSNETNSHYCLIKNLSRFLGHTHKNSHTKLFYCHRCLHGFIRQDLLDSHRPYCDRFDFQKVEYPREGKNNILQFNDYQKAMKVPFVIYADFEALARKIDTCSPNPNTASTTHETKFEACGFAYQVVCTNNNYTKKPVVYRGENVVEHFFESIFKEEEYIREILNDPEPLIMTADSERQFKNATHCHVCDKMFSASDIKVRDHSHIGITGDKQSSSYSNLRGAAHQSCNLSLKDPTFTPVFFHNFRGFDSHLLIEAAGKYKDKKITCIPNNMEKYISFSVGNLRFLDSFQFMSESLGTLVDNLAADGLTYFHQFRNQFQSEDIAKLLLRKNVYCYDYVDSHDKFLETSLPPKQAFYNRVKRDDISDQEYQHAQNVWNTFNMLNLGQYHDLYLLTDVVLLADVFERFRNMTMDYYGLDAAQFYTAPGLAWQAALKMTGVCLELLTTPDMYNFFELGCRGGISMISKKYAKANNKYVKGYDSSKPACHLMYYDANNLYGWAMSQSLPTGLMRWLDESEIDQFDLHTVSSDGDKGYMLEVDLEYPQDLHDKHNSYPLAPSKKLVEDDELSPYSRHLYKDLYGENRHRPKTSKLIPTLENKTKYITHYRNLQLYTNSGMKVTKIHRILEFHQCPWLAKYIQFNTTKRQEARNDFEKNFFKLMCNSVFGKTMENLRNRVDIKLVNSETTLRKYVSKPSFQRCQIFNEDLVGVENKQINLLLNKPVYVGCTILELSKIVMYDFHYNVMQKRYGDQVNLLFTDTDSLCYEIFTDDIYEDMRQFQHCFDTSNYSKDNPLFSTIFKKVPGKMKDELAGRCFITTILFFLLNCLKKFCFTVMFLNINYKKGVFARIS